MKSLQASSETTNEIKKTKRCVDCNEIKDLSEFVKNPVRKDGTTNTCLCCRDKKHRRSKILRAAKDRAKEKGLEFTLTRDDIVIPTNCPCLGIPLIVKPLGEGSIYSDELPYYPSLDRIDSKKGYTPDNIWVVSYRANTIMSDGTPEELRLIADALDDKLLSMETKQMELNI